MAKLSRILVPVEFSPRCQGAVQYAEALSRQFHSEIVLLHVIAPPMAYFGSFDSVSWYTSEQYAQDLAESRKTDLEVFPCAVEEGCTVRRMVVHGDPAQTIVDVAAAEGTDLIVMPTHGYGPFRRFLLGSVTAKVLHDAACPVWTGPHMEAAPEPSEICFRRILCALDLGPQTRSVICWAAHFAADVGAALTMIHAIPATTTRLGPMYFDPEWRGMLIRESHERMEFLMREIGVTAEVQVDSGEVGSVVRDIAVETKADLVVIGRGKGAHAHRRLPMHAYAIAREAPCPVVSV